MDNRLTESTLEGVASWKHFAPEELEVAALLGGTSESSLFAQGLLFSNQAGITEMNGGFMGLFGNAANGGDVAAAAEEP